MSDNKFLLDWAVENLQEWSYFWTDLRCDFTGIFFTKEDWLARGAWIMLGIPKEGVHYSWVDNIADDSRPIQVITKQEWLNAKKEKEQMKNSFTKKDLKTGMVVVTHESAYRVMLGTEHGDVLIDLNDDQYIGLGEYTEWLKYIWKSSDEFDIVAVYSSKCAKHPRFYYYAENPNYTLLWKRKPELSAEAKELQQVIDKLTQDLQEAQKKLERVGGNSK